MKTISTQNTENGITKTYLSERNYLFFNGRKEIICT
jgi:hypothetical protein